MKYEIYQLKLIPKNDNRFFMDSSWIGNKNWNDIKELYENVYTYEHDTDDLEIIFEKFNIDRPEDFTGHSLSMSDIIMVDGEDAYYVDTIGFKHIDV